MFYLFEGVNGIKYLIWKVKMILIYRKVVFYLMVVLFS